MQLVFADKLKRGMVLGRDIQHEKDSGIPLLTQNTTLNDLMISELVRLGVKFVYIDEFLTRQRENARGLSNQRNIYIPKRKPIVSAELKDTAIKSLKGIFNTATNHPNDKAAASSIALNLNEIVDDLITSLTNDDNALVNIYDIKSYDDYTYHHSLSVTILSIAIGYILKLSRDNLKKLGISAIMHDIGKTRIPIAIINKPSRLTDEEFAIIKTHSLEGYNYLQESEIGDDLIRNAVLSHHEKIDGSGYPNRLVGDEIPLWSKIISVADVYDALTSNRPYREPMQPSEGIEYVMGGVDSAFDYDVVSAFVKKVELYPVGSKLELSNGKTGVVLNNKNTFRPVLKLLDTGEILDLQDDTGLRSVTVSKLLRED